MNSIVSLLFLVSIACLAYAAHGREVQKEGVKVETSKKVVIGYLTQWEAWKGPAEGYAVKGAATHLNVDMNAYDIINFSFFGVAKDGSLHSGDYREKGIYKPGVEQQPQPLLHTDVYSSWDLHILWGELENVHYIPTSGELAERIAEQGFVADGNGWKHKATGMKGNMPIPLKAKDGAMGLLDLAHSKGVKVMASIGGWSMSRHFGEVAADNTKLHKFLEGCDQLMNLGFDGIDIDWEYPGGGGMNFQGATTDISNFEFFMQAIRNRIGPTKLVTAAFSASIKNLARYNWKFLAKHMDYFNMMTYDLSGGWSNKAGHNAALYPYKNEEYDGTNLDTLRKWMVSRDVPLNKVNFGAAFYGRGVVTSTENPAVGSPTSKKHVSFFVDGPASSASDFDNWQVYEGAPSYSYITEKLGAGWTQKWDEDAQVPFAVNGKYFLSFDNPASIAAKAQYVVDKGLAGIIVWQIHGDISCDGSYIQRGSKLQECPKLVSPLAKAIDNVFRGAAPPGATAMPPALTTSSTTKKPTATKPTTAQPTTAQPTTAQPTTAQPTTTTKVPAEPTSTTKPASPASTKPSTGKEWNAEHIYVAGDTVSHKGEMYTASWWTKGDEPGHSGRLWVRHGVDRSEWSPDVAYEGGDRVMHKGVEYEAKWWSHNQEPSSGAPWTPYFRRSLQVGFLGQIGRLARRLVGGLVN